MLFALLAANNYANLHGVVHLERLKLTRLSLLQEHPYADTFCEN